MTTNTINGTLGADTLIGTIQDDLINGYDRDDVLSGGDDEIYGGAEDNTISGGDSFDLLDYSQATQGLTVDICISKAWSGTDGDTITGFEGIIGSEFSDPDRHQ